jgi:diguanylate cyclase (GGDEF)-like protein
MARRRRNEDPISIAILDLDHFKRFNDTRGHQAGDRLLVESAAAWRIALREGDVVARIGGEEFAILMLDATLEMARVAVERVRKATPEEQTTSAGLAEWDREEDVTSLLRRADDALYAAKREGRDRAVSSPSPVSS